MYVCQWHLDIVFGRQSEAVKVFSNWTAEMLASSEFRRAQSHRMLCGHIGPSASHLIHEHVFETLADFETALQDMGKPQFKPFPEALASLIVPGSQHWEIYRTLS